MKIKEKDIADIVIKYFEDKGYITYKEVTAKGSKGGGSKRADIVAVKGEEHIVIETKVGFGLSLINQAFTWKSKSNYTFIAIPRKKRTKTRRFGYSICRDYGIGILEVDMKSKSIKKYQDSSYCESPDLPKLYEQHKEFDAGVSSTYLTPFKITKSKIMEYMKENKECFLEDLVNNIDHHYKSKNSAKQSISKLIKVGVIELSLTKYKNKLYVKYGNS